MARVDYIEKPIVRVVPSRQFGRDATVSAIGHFENAIAVVVVKSVHLQSDQKSVVVIICRRASKSTDVILQWLLELTLAGIHRLDEIETTGWGNRIIVCCRYKQVGPTVVIRRPGSRVIVCRARTGENNIGCAAEAPSLVVG